MPHKAKLQARQSPHQCLRKAKKDSQIKIKSCFTLVKLSPGGKQHKTKQNTLVLVLIHCPWDSSTRKYQTKGWLVCAKFILHRDGIPLKWASNKLVTIFCSQFYRQRVHLVLNDVLNLYLWLSRTESSVKIITNLLEKTAVRYGFVCSTGKVQNGICDGWVAASWHLAYKKTENRNIYMLEPDARETEILDEADVSWIGLISTDFRPL